MPRNTFVSSSNAIYPSLSLDPFTRTTTISKKSNCRDIEDEEDEAVEAGAGSGRG